MFKDSILMNWSIIQCTKRYLGFKFVNILCKIESKVKNIDAKTIVQDYINKLWTELKEFNV